MTTATPCVSLDVIETLYDRAMSIIDNNVHLGSERGVIVLPVTNSGDTIHKLQNELKNNGFKASVNIGREYMELIVFKDVYIRTKNIRLVLAKMRMI